MISELKKYWLFIIVFIVINVLVFEGANIISQPNQTADLISPVVLVFGLIALASSFFAALVVTALLFSKTRDYIEQLNVIMISVALFSIIIIILNFWVLFFFTQEQWNQGYLDAAMSLPTDFEFNQEQFKSMTFFQSIQQALSLVIESAGSAYFGFLLSRKLFAKKG